MNGILNENRKKEECEESSATSQKTVSNTTNSTKNWQLDPNLLSDFDQNGYFVLNSSQIPQKIKISLAKSEQAAEIAELLINFGDGALACGDNFEKAFEKTIRHISDNLGFVATVDFPGRTSNNIETIVGYQGITLWKHSKIAEPGSAVTHPEFRGMGINTTIKKLAIVKTLEMHPDLDLIFFCREKSTSVGILEKIGAVQVTIEEMQQKWPQLADPKRLKRRQELGMRVFKLEF